MIPNEHGVKMPVIVLNHHHEIWEFDTLDEAKVVRQNKANQLFGNFVHSSEKL
jgi:hypothetical protein